VLLTGALCAGCAGGSPSHAGDGHLGVSATIPRAWSAIWRPCHACADPRGIFVAASYRTPAGPRRLTCSRIPAGGVVLSLDEVLPGLAGYPAPPPGDYPPRPAAFRIGDLGRFQVTEGCDQRRSELFRFRDSGRLLYAWAIFGPHPSRAVRRGAEAVLNSLRIAPRS
jgi:hypothetical protein